MNTALLQSIYAAKRSRRNALAHLSIDQRVEIIEKLRNMAVSIRGGKRRAA